MENTDSRRPRKPVNYADLGGVALDDDFVDFKASSHSTTDKKEKVNGEGQKDRERKHSRDKHKDHKKHKKDRDRHREDRDRDRKRHSKERDERKSREHKKKQQRSEEKDDKHSQDSSKKEESSGSSSDSSGTQKLQDMLSTSVPDVASPLVSPSRRNPKPRLSLEDKLFQKELEVVLELSKVESSQNSPNTLEAKEHERTERRTSLNEKEPQLPSSPKPTEELNIEEDHSSPNQAPPPPPVLETASVPECVETVTQKPNPPPPSRGVDTLQESLPSTSTGKYAKRIRKTVVFKEDSDSEDFTGFDSDMDALSDASEASDFMPSPKKKKSKEPKKSKNSKPTKSNTRKASIKSTGQHKANDVMLSPRIHPTLAKENTNPKTPATPPPATHSPRASAAPELKVSLTPPVLPQTKAVTKKTSVTKPVKRPLISMPSSSSSGASSIALVKTPFRSPLSPSSNSGHLISPTTSTGSNPLYRSTGLRLGLSRRAILKPLHPSVAGRIT